MSMTKAQRREVFDKYGGRCAYCGCELQKGWHVDEIEPVRRNKEWNHAKKRWEPHADVPYQHSERLNFDNQNPSCASCNINKHSGSLEDFRKMIAYFITTLNKSSVQYKIAKRYGLIQETPKPVIFYFETLNP